MDLFDHEKECLDELGEPWTEVHVFMDQFAQKYRGFLHRRLLHHKLGIELAVQKFGETARRAAELHVTQDIGFIPNTWKNLKERTCEEMKQEKDLKELYGEEVFKEIERNNA